MTRRICGTNYWDSTLAEGVRYFEIRDPQENEIEAVEEN
jgi:hypothetical protein